MLTNSQKKHSTWQNHYNFGFIWTEKATHFLPDKFYSALVAQRKEKVKINSNHQLYIEHFELDSNLSLVLVSLVYCGSFFFFSLSFLCLISKSFISKTLIFYALFSALFSYVLVSHHLRHKQDLQSPSSFFISHIISYKQHIHYHHSDN